MPSFKTEKIDGLILLCVDLIPVEPIVLAILVSQ